MQLLMPASYTADFAPLTLKPKWLWGCAVENCDTRETEAQCTQYPELLLHFSSVPTAWQADTTLSSQAHKNRNVPSCKRYHKELAKELEILPSIMLANQHYALMLSFLSRYTFCPQSIDNIHLHPSQEKTFVSCEDLFQR